MISDEGEDNPATPLDELDERVDEPFPAPAARKGGLRLALRFLLPGGPGASHDEDWSRAARWIVPLGLAIGLIQVAVFRGAWRRFGEVSGVRLIPALAVWLGDVLLWGAVLFKGAALTTRRLAAADEQRQSIPYPVMVMMIVALLTKFILILSIPVGYFWWPGDWRRHLNFLYPRPVYRPLLLAPIWGRWAMLMASCTGRFAGHADPAARALGAHVRLRIVLFWFVPPTILTAVYCSRQGNLLLGVIISLWVLGATYLLSAALAHRLGGQDRWTVLCVALAAEIAFLFGFLTIGPFGY